MGSNKSKDFSKVYYSKTVGTQTIEHLPEVPVKYRGSDIVFKDGKRFPVDDFSRFVKRGNKFIPVVCADRWEGEKTYDLAPLLAVGVAELVGMCSFLVNQANRAYLGWCHNLDFCKNWQVAMDVAKSIEMANPMILLSEAMRGSLIDSCFPTIRRVYCTLMALKLTNPQSFCRAILEGIKVTMSISPIFFVSRDNWKHEEHDTGWANSEKWYQNIIDTQLARTGAVHYGGLFESHKITDCRGLGISLLCIFMIDLFKTHALQGGSSFQKELMSSNEMRERAERMFDKCLGTDAVADYINTLDWGKVLASDMSMAIAGQAGFMPIGCSEMVNLQGVAVGRGIYEAAVLYNHATQSYGKKYKGYIQPLDCYYGSMSDIIHTFIDFGLSEHGIQYEEKLRKDNHERLLAEVLERVGIDKIREDARKEAEKKFHAEHNRLKKEVDRLTSELSRSESLCKEADVSLVKKQDVIDALREEVKELHIQLHSLTEIEDADLAEVVKDEDVSVEEMLEFVNQFKLVIIGDKNLLANRVAKFGFKNFEVLRDMSNIDVTGDFFCVYTRFISHSLVYTVESRHCDSLDQFFYFNGTNMEALLKTYYAFAKKWLEGD